VYCAAAELDFFPLFVAFPDVISLGDAGGGDDYNKLIYLLIYSIQSLIVHNRTNVLCDGKKNIKPEEFVLHT
jgi:hypothetical protein